MKVKWISGHCDEGFSFIIEVRASATGKHASIKLEHNGKTVHVHNLTSDDVRELAEVVK